MADAAESAGATATAGDSQAASDSPTADDGATTEHDGPLAPVYALQTAPRRRWQAFVLAVVVGLLLATLHWTGLLLGGALVGWTQPRLRDALFAGFAFALLALLAFALLLAIEDLVPTVLATGQIAIVSVVIGLVTPLLGALSRGLARNAHSS